MNLLQTRWSNEDPHWPLSVAEAVQCLIDLSMYYELNELVSFYPNEDLFIVTEHHRLGRWIRNNFGLWQNNQPLLKDCQCDHPDDASSVILRALWKRISKAQDR